MCVTFPASLVRGWDSLRGPTMVMAASAVVAGLKERALASARGGRGGRCAQETAGKAGQLDREGSPCHNTEPAARSAVRGPARPAGVAATKGEINDDSETAELLGELSRKGVWGGAGGAGG